MVGVGDMSNQNGAVLTVEQDREPDHVRPVQIL